MNTVCPAARNRCWRFPGHSRSRAYAPERWVTATEDLDWMLEALDDSPHVPVAPRHALRKRRRSARVELLSQEVVEWRDPRKRKRNPAMTDAARDEVGRAVSHIVAAKRGRRHNRVTSFIFRRQLTIEWGQCDPAGIVFNSRFFEMFDISTWLLFEAALGVKPHELAETFGIIGIALVDARANFLKPAKFGDVVEIASRVTRIPPLQLRRRAPADDRRRTGGRRPRDPRLGRARQDRSGQDRRRRHSARGHCPLRVGRCDRPAKVPAIPDNWSGEGGRAGVS